MTAASKRKRSKEVWAERVIFVWAVGVLATDIKETVYLRIHWVISILAIALIWPYLRTTQWNVKYPARIPGWLLVASVCVPIFSGASAFYSLAEAVKLAIIVLGGIAFFIARGNLAHSAFRAFVVSVYLNLILLLGGFLGLGGASIMAVGRWGTILSYPGSLWRVAMTVWVYAAYLSLTRRSIASVGLLVASTLLVYMDGARTAFLIVLIGAFYVTFVVAAEAGRLRRAVLIGAVGVAVLLTAVVLSGILAGNGGSESEGLLGRVSQLTSSVQEAGIEGLQSADVIRFQMLQDAVEAIHAHPVLGTGIGTTMTDTFAGPIVIHMTYLQVWADMGILGFVAVVWLMWSWMFFASKAMRRIRELADPVKRAVYYNAVFLLVMYGIVAMFHPLSTEWSEWIVFVIPYALFWEIAGDREGAPPRREILAGNPEPEMSS